MCLGSHHDQCRFLEPKCFFLFFCLGIKHLRNYCKNRFHFFSFFFVGWWMVVMNEWRSLNTCLTRFLTHRNPLVSVCRDAETTLCPESCPVHSFHVCGKSLQPIMNYSCLRKLGSTLQELVGMWLPYYLEISLFLIII